ncbi:hypothetical protein QE152_g8485 [Popillia japonica]|uniref:Uncharacterized protein n=1 Tax=Popillia japonica TaxID=7064 RepID=A0AAW1MBK9_POPJA
MKKTGTSKRLKLDKESKKPLSKDEIEALASSLWESSSEDASRIDSEEESLDEVGEIEMKTSHGFDEWTIKQRALALYG